MPLILPKPEPPSQVLDKLWLGTIWAAKQLLAGNERGIGLVLNCTDETLPRIPGVTTLQLGLLDREPIPPAKLDYAVRVLQEFLRGRPTRGVLVCCHASQSRSPAIVTACLLGCGFRFREAYERVQQCHSTTKIHPELLQSLKAYFGTNLSASEDFFQGAIA
jgi:hypothetical protein